MRWKACLIFAGLLACAGCSGLTLESADFAWPLESVLAVDDNGIVSDERYSIEFNAIPVFFEEHQDSSAFTGKEVRLIRDQLGFYYLTANEFKNVYVFQADDGQLVLDTKIPISETGIMRPAFNQRGNYIELVDANNRTLSLTHNGIEGEM
jgi:hypothetical protein